MLRSDPAAQAHEVALKTRVLERYLDPGMTFLEVGAGDCSLALHLCPRVRRVLVVEPATDFVRELEAPANFELLAGDQPLGTLPAGSVDLAFSSHFIEHLHPEDAVDHAADMRRVLAPGGRYVCATPNRLWGPHDVSRYFDDVPTGLHLKEYGYGELAALLRGAGFSRVSVVRGVGAEPRHGALLPYRLAESALGLLSTSSRRRVLELLSRSARAPFRPFEQVVVVAQ
jgi:SAM-dependent methyltransferase